MARLKAAPLDENRASAMALQALAFLAMDADRLSRFLALTGCGPGDIRRLAASSEFQASVLAHLLSDESLLLLFASQYGVAPETVAPAHALLASAA